MKPMHPGDGVFSDRVPLAHELGADILQVQHTIFNSSAIVKHHNQALSICFAAAHGTREDEIDVLIWDEYVEFSAI
jgi:hypothetical protein